MVDSLHETDAQRLNVGSAWKRLHIAETFGLPAKFDRAILLPNGFAVTNEPGTVVFKQTQPGVAARIAYHGVGEFVEVGDLTAERLPDVIQKVQANPSYRDRARYFRRVIARTHGLDLAANVIEHAFKKNQIVDSARQPAAPLLR